MTFGELASVLPFGEMSSQQSDDSDRVVSTPEGDILIASSSGIVGTSSAYLGSPALFGFSLRRKTSLDRVLGGDTILVPLSVTSIHNGPSHLSNDVTSENTILLNSPQEQVFCC
jgi:hypothetical protein